MVYLIIVIFLSYIVVVMLLASGWQKISRPVLPSAHHDHFITVVIPVRNEASTITALLTDLSRQSYTTFEVIVVDDHSADATAEAVRPFTENDSRFRCIPNEGEGKKLALTTGIREARGAVIVTTDGDCRLGDRWLEVVNRHFQKDDIIMAFGGVAIGQGGGLFTDMQAIEFSSLIGSGAAAWAWGYPIFCNGANLAFRKLAFEEVKGYDGNTRIASGDDEFLMRKVVARYSEGLIFMGDASAVVRTQPAASVRDLFRQRIRWAGKWKHNTSLHTKLLAVYIYLVQIVFIITMALLFFGDSDIRIVAGSLLIIRFTAEASFLRRVCRFLNVQWRWLAFSGLQVVYPLYVVVVGLFSNFITVRWKGRVT